MQLGPIYARLYFSATRRQEGGFRQTRRFARSRASSRLCRLVSPGACLHFNEGGLEESRKYGMLSRP